MLLHVDQARMLAQDGPGHQRDCQQLESGNGGRAVVDTGARLRGECYCRAVAYDVLDAFEYALICHCSNCRRATGSAFKPLAGIRAEHLSLNCDEADVLRFGGEASHDVHCRRCGSLLLSVVRGGAYVHVALGTLVDTPSIRPQAHIFVGSKAAWHTICDDLAQFEELPPN